MSLIIPSLSKDNSISMSVGLKFKLIQVFNDNTKSEIKLIKSSERDTFYGLFDEEDIDFEIVVDNRDNVYDIGFEIILKSQTKRELFYIKSGKYDELKALDTNGKHLHFISQSTEEGKLLVAMSAHNNNTTIEEEAINCSRIGFKVEVETQKPVSKGRRIQVIVKTMTGKTINLSVGENSTVDVLKAMIEKADGMPIKEQSLNFDGYYSLSDNKRTLIDYGLKNKSVVYLIKVLRGGGPGPDPQEVEKSKRKPIIKPKLKSIGERGVVCFSGKTNQRFSPYNSFMPSKEYLIKPFTIELRMKPKYSLNK